MNKEKDIKFLEDLLPSLYYVCELSETWGYEVRSCEPNFGIKDKAWENYYLPKIKEYFGVSLSEIYSAVCTEHTHFKIYVSTSPTVNITFLGDELKIGGVDVNGEATQDVELEMNIITDGKYNPSEWFKKYKEWEKITASTKLTFDEQLCASLIIDLKLDVYTDDGFITKGTFEKTTTLDLTNKGFCKLPHFVSLFTNLEVLNLTGNFVKIEDLPESVLNNDRLTIISNKPIYNKKYTNPHKCCFMVTGV